MEIGRHCCLCQAEQPLNLVHKTICECSFLVWNPLAPKVTKTWRKQSDHCHTYLSQHSAPEQFGAGSCSFHWKVKLQCFLLIKDFTAANTLPAVPEASTSRSSGGQEQKPGYSEDVFSRLKSLHLGLPTVHSLGSLTASQPKEKVHSWILKAFHLSWNVKEMFC